MQDYIVEVREIWVQNVLIKNAKSARGAVAAVTNGDGKYLEFTYFYAVDPDTWTVYPTNIEKAQ